MSAVEFLSLLDETPKRNQVYVTKAETTVVFAVPLGFSISGGVRETELSPLALASYVDLCDRLPSSFLEGDGQLFTTQLDANGVFHFLVASGEISYTAAIIIIPNLTLGSKPIEVESLCIKTVLTRCLGEFSRWAPVLENMGGYNAVHFTPVQELGGIGSAYSIKDHTKIASTAGKVTWDELSTFLGKLRNKMLSFTDLVLNHVANDSALLLRNPEVAFTASLVVGAKGANSPQLTAALELDLALQKLPLVAIATEQDVQRAVIEAERIWDQLKLWEYFVLDVDENMKLFKPGEQRANGSFESLLEEFKITCVKFEHAERNKHRILPDKAQLLFDNEVEFKKCLETYNLHKYRELNSHKDAMKTNLYHRVKYLFLESGEKQTSLFEPYFVEVKKGLYAVCNGWTITGDERDQIYLRRDLIVWTDLVKLRYGKSKEDSPVLWEYMEAYVEKTAELFDGIRLDNAHTTPLHVAQYMLDVARKKSRNIYIFAELFTGSDELNAEFVSKTGVHSIVVEAMRATDADGLSRLQHRHGGAPVGSIQQHYPAKTLEQRYVPTIFMDCSHDNKTPSEERQTEDTLSNGVSVWSTFSSVGSSWGVDELVPKNISVASERRIYPVTKGLGISGAKQRFGELHQQLANSGYTEIYVHRQGNLILTMRHNPSTFDAFYFLVRTAFKNNFELTPQEREVQINAPMIEFVAAYSLDTNAAEQYKANSEIINSLVGTKLKSLTKDGLYQISSTNNGVRLHLSHDFPLGAALCLRSVVSEESRAALVSFEENLAGLGKHVKGLSLLDLNVVMFRSAPEERDTTNLSSYNVPGYGYLTYCGIAGVFYAIQASKKNLGSAIYENLRQGDWLLHYLHKRLTAPIKQLLHSSQQQDQQEPQKNSPQILSLALYLSKLADALSKFPRYLIPKYFTILVDVLFKQCFDRCMELMPRVKQKGGLFARLALTSVQLYGQVPNADIRDNFEAKFELLVDQKWRGCRATLSAGLPHFSTGFMRCWGRDTCISLPGLFIHTGRVEEARDLLKIFAACVKNGIVPNLLDGARRPRYNSRDSTWWWFQALQELYRADRDDTIHLLKTRVPRLYATRAATPSSSIAEVMQEIMQSHASGISFRDDGLDHDMRSGGFNISTNLDVKSGLIYGGNGDNCGTWMDKMGSSDIAGNRGVPATPRDGCAVEIAGLLRSAIRFLHELSLEGNYQHKGVSVVSARKNFFSWEDWGATLDKNFERLFYVPVDPTKDVNYDIDPAIVHRRGIFKDSHGSTKRYTDYQLRPNFAIAMVVAPELFRDRLNAKNAIEFAFEVLRGPIGVKTLDPRDMQYRPDYMNQVDSADFLTSRGFNYHQGPEWVWPLGFMLRARLHFTPDEAKDALKQDIWRILDVHRHLLRSSSWFGVVELTNGNGAPCPDSCFTQAWSAATLVELLMDLLNSK